jgi:hypothetical protein
MRAVAGSLEAWTGMWEAMWEAESARRVGAAAVDPEHGHGLANISQGG